MIRYRLRSILVYSASMHAFICDSTGRPASDPGIPAVTSGGLRSGAWIPGARLKMNPDTNAASSTSSSSRSIAASPPRGEIFRNTGTPIRTSFSASISRRVCPGSLKKSRPVFVFGQLRFSVT